MTILRQNITRRCLLMLVSGVVLVTSYGLGQVSVIPAPQELTLANADAPFVLDSSTRLVWRSQPADAHYVADFLSRLLAMPAAVPAGHGNEHDVILLDFGPDNWPQYLRTSSSPEAYVLHVDAQRIQIQAKTAHGAFNAAQTLRQILPATIEDCVPPAHQQLQQLSRDSPTKTRCYDRLEVPALTIRDAPRYAWRGLLVDTSRHFFNVDELKKFLELMALHKFNTFHWHLTDDQGWRIEIKKYPRLAERGAWREESPMRSNPKRGDRVRYGGYYTQDQIRDIVAYAAARFINVVPEIEIPGHSAAALASYPEFGNTDVPGYAPAVATRWGGGTDNIFAPKETTFAFLENVLTEVMELFPSRYIHIGGDEVDAEVWGKSAAAQAFLAQQHFDSCEQIQGYFTRHIAEFLAAHGRTPVGWDEVLESKAPSTTAIMVWRTTAEEEIPPSPGVWENLMPALKSGHDVILVPDSHFYLDDEEIKSNATGDPGHDRWFTPLSHVYFFDPPVELLSAAEQEHILGMEGALWSEYIWDYNKLEYMAFPRASAISEVAWSARDHRNFADFEKRLRSLELHLDKLGVNYRRSTADVGLHGIPD